jgi:exopolyphosphatase / guanosine-5'-triphosphate,3'-diphosphate pyrophosphatase
MDWYKDIPDENKPAMDSILDLARTCNVDLEHSGNTSEIALSLFDFLQNHHKLGSEERFWLVSAGALQDVGKVDGHKDHHKASQQIILSTAMLPFSNKERLIIGSIVRYHKGPLPKKTQDHLMALENKDQRHVIYLASLLRVANGLRQAQIIDVKFGHKKITILINGSKPHTSDYLRVEKSKDLMETAFKHKVSFAWQIAKAHNTPLDTSKI